MDVRVLGPLELVEGGSDLTPSRRKHRTLLALLALRAGDVVSTDELIEALWGPDPPGTAAKALHGHVSALRKMLGAETIETRAPGYVLRLAPGQTDLGRFDELLGRARGEADTARKSELLRSALALFRGDPLSDFRYDEFARDEIARIEELRLTAIEERIDADLELGRQEELVPELEQLVSANPLRERPRRQLMLALYRSGRQGEALRVFQEARRAAVDELGLEPGPALRRLERQILAQDPALDAGAEDTRPRGTVTFLFSDIEGSTRLLHELGPSYAQALEQHRLLLRDAFARHQGFEVDTQGDAFFVAFPSAKDAVGGAIESQRALAAHTFPSAAELRVRMGVHTCEAQPTAEGYVGIGVHRAARICAAGHGGQVLVSQTTRELLEEEPLDEVALRDLGPHRLKDLTQAERIYQLLAPGLEREFPALETLEARPTNLPVQATALVGRERELRDARERLLADEVRVLTLTGAGGVGKTRLALQAAADALEQFPAGTFFIDLSPIADSATVVPAIAGVLGVRESGTQPLAEALGEHLAERKLLLVLDNFEHVVAAAPAVSDLLAAAADVKVLATSREPLHLARERVYPVPPLAGEDGVALFVERAQSVRPDFELTEANASAVAEICRRLDGLPLAIELAAARVVLFPPAALLKRLDERLRLLVGGPRDRPERQRTLRAAVDWSYELLAEPRQALLARLSVFAGGWTLESAEAVGNGDLDVVEGLSSLLDKSLVRLEGTDEEPRFTMLETIREYARERLEERGEAEQFRRRHAEHLLAFAERERELARGPQEIESLDRVELELDNVRSALDWTIEAGEGVLGLTLAEALEPFWTRRGHLREGLRSLEPLLAASPEAPVAIRAGAYGVAGRLASELGSPERARPWYEQSLELARSAGDREREAWALHGLGFVSALEREHAEARALLEKSHDLFVVLGQHAPAGGRLTFLAWIAQREDDVAAMRSYLERALDAYRRAGDVSGVAGVLAGLGDVALMEGDWAKARDYFAAALTDASVPRDYLYFFAGIAVVAAKAGQATAASRLWGAAQQIEFELDASFMDEERALYTSLLGELDPAEVEAGGALSTEEACELARDVVAAAP